MTNYKRPRKWWPQTSLWVVLVTGGLFLTFTVAIVRELLNGHQVRLQVKNLQLQVSSEKQRQAQLQDLIDYLGSPTFQEREARMKLGLKKVGEQVIVIPSSTENMNQQASFRQTLQTDSNGKPLSYPQRWWNYFFTSHSKSTTPNT